MTEPQSQPPPALVVPVTPLQQNCTLFWCTRTMKAALVDPGGDIDKLLAAVQSRGVEVEKLLLTTGISTTRAPPPRSSAA